MGRHSRRAPADTTDNTSTSGTPLSQRVGPQPGPGPGRRRRGRAADGTPEDGTPAHGTPAHGTPAHGVPHVRGGHPEQREPGGAWGDSTDAGTDTGTDAGTGPGPRVVTGPGAVPGPRQDYVAAFPERQGRRPDARTPAPRDPYASVTRWETEADGGGDGNGDGDLADGEDGGGRKRGRSRALSGVVAAAVTTVIAVVVAGQLAGGAEDSDPKTRAAPGGARDTEDPASRSDRRPTPAEVRKEAPATYDDKMKETYPLDAKLKASGDFAAMAGFDKAPGKGQKFRYRVDVEKGLGLDGKLFAQAVQKTLNDDRSWAHAGARTFERISSGRPDFVITLASPGTTGVWCAKSGLDTTQDNVSCDSAATDRVMINAYRWAQGAPTYGDEVKKKFGNAIHPYRQMLINHEVGHRLGFNHTDCSKSGDLAPVMQQQTKFLEHDGIKCKANPWAFPKS
ncbi:DUF3152 domain-containing protein [Streptomyces sp. Je 1-369]|uniref:DUF3152 domain-containing protein n=1 Tax=Streptomyces sp. Je 1-369 TaxID=2966192 RepID=UPI002285A320|nr:DUF3152 domain-containing protein [Streptomyces sp. Je 1-369]WAL97704.1 DUF3152 domain-containing protein [Streptomyces sp. Je 1-369]